nr:hypothetical protein [Tanacetum cinerariifolium]
MQTRSSSKLARNQTSGPTSSTNPTPKGRIRRSSKQKVENSRFEEHLTPVATMTDNCTMAEMLRAPTEGCAEAIVVSSILAEQFELKNNQDSLNAAAGANLLEKSPQDALTIIKNKSKVRNSRSKSIASTVNACDNHSSSEIAKLTHAVNQQTSAMTTTMTAMLKQLQSNPPPAQVKTVEGICVTCEAQSNQNFHLNELEKIKRMNDVSLKAIQMQIDMVKNELRNEIKTSIQTSLSNQTNEIKNMMASLLQMNTASTLGSRTLPGNTIANPKGELKAITTRSGLATDGPTVPNPPKSVNPEEDVCVEETYTGPDHTEYIIKVPPPPQEKDDIQIQKFWNMFKQLHLNINLAEALVLMPKYQKMLKALLSNKEKLQELANTPLNKNCSAVILKKLPEKIGDPRKFVIPCGFIGKFTFPADFVIVDYESDSRVPLILGRPFLRTVRAPIDVHGEEIILRDGDERLTLNMKHDTTSYSNHPHRELVNLINIFNILSEDCLEDLVSNKQSGNPTFSLHKEIASPKVIHELNDSKGCTLLSAKLPEIDSFNDIHPYFNDDPISGSTIYSANLLLEEFTNELALITYPPDYDDNLKCDIESDLREIEFLLYQGKDSNFKDSIDQSNLATCDDLFVDPT